MASSCAGSEAAISSIATSTEGESVSFHHSRDTFPPKTLRKMIQLARWSREDLERLGLR